MKRLGPSLFHIALIVPIAVALFVPPVSLGDTGTYLEPAQRFAEGHGLTLADGTAMTYRLPLYPVLLALAIKVSGGWIKAFSLLNALCVIASVVVLQPLMKRGSLRDLVSACAILYPPFLTFVPLLLQECVQGLTLSFVAVAAVRALDDPGPLRAFTLGTLIGLSALCKSTVLPTGALLCGVFFFTALRTRERSRVAVSCLLLLLGLLAPLFAWGARNRAAVGRFAFLNENGAINFFASTIDTVIPSWGAIPEVEEERRQWIPSPERPTFESHLYRAGWRRIVSEPAKFLRFSIDRAFRFMLPARDWFVARGYAETGNFGAVYIVATAFQVFLFGGALLLLVRCISGTAPRSFVVLPLIVFAHQLVYALSFASPRYSVPLTPLLFFSWGVITSQREASPATVA